jgi:hypothetical protein
MPERDAVLLIAPHAVAVRSTQVDRVVHTLGDAL